MTLLPGLVSLAPTNIVGVDTNDPINSKIANELVEAGFSFVLRYIRRRQFNQNDITPNEARKILASDLGLMVVQHVENESAWTPSLDLGLEYGKTAALEAWKLGLPRGVTVWCDLEGVAKDVPSRDVILYCNAWFKEVQAFGFQPGLYIGWRCGLTAQQLYYNLKFTRYWSAYNLNSDEAPLVRGVCMRQHVTPPSFPVGYAGQFQTDSINSGDLLGDRPTLLVPEGWPG